MERPGDQPEVEELQPGAPAWAICSFPTAHRPHRSTHEACSGSEAKGASDAVPTTADIRIAAPEDLLALVPALAGYRPARSLVCLVFRGRRVIGVLRHDLPGRATDRERLVGAIVGVLCRMPETDGLVAVTYSPAAYRSRAAAGERALLRLLGRRTREAGFTMHDGLCVSADAWGSVFDRNAHPDGRPLDLVDSSPVLAHPALLGFEPGTVDALAALGEPEAQLMADTRSALERLDFDADLRAGSSAEAMPGSELDPGLGDPIAFVETLLGAETAADPSSPGPVAIAGLIRAAEQPVLRDGVLLQIAFGEVVGRLALGDPALVERSIDGVCARSSRGAPGPSALELHREPRPGSIGAKLSRMLLGETGERPEPERLKRGSVIIRFAAAAAPDGRRAGLLCMAAWIAWALGHGSAAGVLIDAALRDQPHLPMANLLARYVSTGALPEWVFHSRDAETSSAGGALTG